MSVQQVEFLVQKAQILLHGVSERVASKERGTGNHSVMDASFFEEYDLAKAEFIIGRALRLLQEGAASRPSLPLSKSACLQATANEAALVSTHVSE
ncbi:MAG: hypothetical protein FWC38_00830 [Proteobacteria bacterium]|nr:hypothetical protein [Pseudomonadota bacterium]MCL2306787.1 hypothetical protein [Pseudomonadota bacterium]